MTTLKAINILFAIIIKSLAVNLILFNAITSTENGMLNVPIMNETHFLNMWYNGWWKTLDFARLRGRFGRWIELQMITGERSRCLALGYIITRNWVQFDQSTVQGRACHKKLIARMLQYCYIIVGYKILKTCSSFSLPPLQELKSRWSYTAFVSQFTVWLYNYFSKPLWTVYFNAKFISRFLSMIAPNYSPVCRMTNYSQCISVIIKW